MVIISGAAIPNKLSITSFSHFIHSFSLGSIQIDIYTLQISGVAVMYLGLGLFLTDFLPYFLHL